MRLTTECAGEVHEAALREILGPQASEEELRRIARIAVAGG